MNAGQIIEARRSYQDIAAEFTFSGHERRQIADLLAGERNVEAAERAVTHAFWLVKDGQTASPAARRDRHLEIAELAGRLTSLMRDGSLFGGGAPAAYLADFQEIADGDVIFQRRWIRALMFLEKRCASAARTGEVPGLGDAKDIEWLLRFGGDELRNHLSELLLRVYCDKAALRPMAYENSNAVQLLQIAVPSALRYARLHLGYSVKGKPGADLSISATWAKKFIGAFNRHEA